MNTPITDLMTKGFVVVLYPKNLRHAVAQTMESWKRFCSLSAENKKKIPYSNNADGVGYELKDGIGLASDRKENFDVTTAGRRWLEIHIRKIQDPIVLEFVKNAVALVHIIRPIILDFASQSEKAFHLQDFVDEVKKGDDAFFIRFIHYFVTEEIGRETAQAHADQSGFTLHLFETAPGLQCFTFDRSWVDMPVSEGETVIIPSMQIQLRSQGRIKALCHRVITTSETAGKDRYSAVCFVQLKKTPKYNRDVHGRLQEKEPGFNYNLSPEKLQQFFK